MFALAAAALMLAQTAPAPARAEDAATGDAAAATAPRVRAPRPIPADLPVAPPVITAFPGQYALPPTGPFPTQPKVCVAITEIGARAACFENVAFNWGRLDRYAAANAALAPPAPDEKRVVFLGDSITDNWSRPVAGGFFPGRPYVNRGIGGQTTAQMLVRFRADVVALAPRLVVILAGTNDLAGNAGPTTRREIEGNLASLAELAEANGIRVALASILPITDEKRDAAGKPRLRSPERPPDVIRALNRRIGEYARKHHHVYVDYHASMVDARGFLRAELTDDGLHPNTAGYAVMAPIAERAITTALAR